MVPLFDNPEYHFSRVTSILLHLTTNITAHYCAPPILGVTYHDYLDTRHGSFLIFGPPHLTDSVRVF